MHEKLTGSSSTGAGPPAVPCTGGLLAARLVPPPVFCPQAHHSTWPPVQMSLAILAHKGKKKGTTARWLLSLFVVLGTKPGHHAFWASALLLGHVASPIPVSFFF